MRVFEVFERVFSYRASDVPREHLGLGLAIAKRIVEGHGGTMAAGNRADGGATFEVRLPAS
jgi:K+-sensing histidine kinase KdpD